MDIVGRLKWLIDKADVNTIFSIGPMLRGEKVFEIQKGALLGKYHEIECVSDISIWIDNGRLYYKDKDGEKCTLITPKEIQELKELVNNRFNKFLKFWGIV